MKTYHVTPQLAGFNRKRTVLRILFAAGLFAALQMLLNVLWPSSTAPANLFWDSVRAMISGAIFALLFVLVFMKRILTCEVVVSEDRIAQLHDGFGFQRSVRKDEARTVAESNGGILSAPALRISKHGPLGTWFWGCIWIPKAVPEYEYVRDLALSWKSRLQA